MKYANPNSRLLYAAALLVLGIVGFIGCSGGSNRVAVTGNISYDGQPVPEGEIVFFPTREGLPMATGKIENGTYQISREAGPAPGPYTAKITGFRESKTTIKPPPYLSDDSSPTTTKEQFIPPQFNERSTLSVEIEAGRENTHDFTLSKPGV